jgi:hypothetical protein
MDSPSIEELDENSRTAVDHRGRLAVVSTHAAALEAQGTMLTALRGVFGFESESRRGTLTVADGSSPGFTRLVIYIYRFDGEVPSVPVRMEAEVREEWIRQAIDGCATHGEEVEELLQALFDVARLPDQRTVRISAPVH